MPFLDEDQAVVVEDDARRVDDRLVTAETILQVISTLAGGVPPNQVNNPPNGIGRLQRNGDTNVGDVFTRLQAIEERIELIHDLVEMLEDHRQTIETLMIRHGLDRISQPLANGDGPAPRDPAANAGANGLEVDDAIQAAVTEQHQPRVRPYHVTTAIMDNLVTCVNRLVDQLNGISAQINQIFTQQGNIVNQIDHLTTFFNGRYVDLSAQFRDLRAESRVLTNRCGNLEIEIGRLQQDGLPANQHLLQAHNQNTPQSQLLSSAVQNSTTATTSALHTPQHHTQPHPSIIMSANMEREKPDSTNSTTATAAMESGQPSDPAASLNPQAQDFTPASLAGPQSSVTQHDPFAHIPRDQIAQEMTTAFYAVTKGMKFKTLDESIHNPNPRSTQTSKPTPTLSDEELARRFRERSEKQGIKITDINAPDDNAGTLTRSQIDEAAYGSLDLFEKAFASPKEEQQKEELVAPEGAVKEPEKEEQEQEKPAKLAEKSDLMTDFLKVFHARYMKPEAAGSGKPTVTIPPANIGDLNVFNELLQHAPTSIPRVREGWAWEEVAGEGGRQCWRLRIVR